MFWLVESCAQGLVPMLSKVRAESAVEAAWKVAPVSLSQRRRGVVFRVHELDEELVFSGAFEFPDAQVTMTEGGGVRTAALGHFVLTETTTRVADLLARLHD
jgi:hypothetical protein